MKQILNPYEGQSALSASQIADKHSRTVNVYNLPLAITQQQVVDYFMQFGKAERMWLKAEEDHQVCSILYKLSLSAESATKADGKQLMGQVIEVILLKSILENRMEDKQPRKVMVSNLNVMTREFDIKSKLLKGVPIESIQLFKEVNKQTVSAIVILVQSQDQARVLAMTGRKLMNHCVQVTLVDRQVEDLLDTMRKDLMDIKDKIISEDIQDDIEPMDSWQGFKNTSVVIGNYEDLADKNVISVPPRVIRKQIKKAKARQGVLEGDQMFALQQKVKKKFEVKNDKELFNNRNEREVRKKRRVQQEINNLKKQGKNDKIKLLFEKKKEIDYKITRTIHRY